MFTVLIGPSNEMKQHDKQEMIVAHYFLLITIMIGLGGEI
jgi:hypothetical protein